MELTGRDYLIYLAIKYKGDWDNIMRAARAHQRFDDNEIVEAVSGIQSKVITFIDKEYPECLKRCCKPPLVLFYYGNIDLLSDENLVAYIGSRDSSSYGEEMARKIAKEMVEKGITLMSGLARGIDSRAIEAALEAHGRVIGVLGSGIDNPWPISSIPLYNRLKKEGLVLSEYAGEIEPMPAHFPIRNRIVGGAPKGVVVGEAATRSGTLITVGYALTSGREVGAVPHRANEESSCNVLIKQGAWLIESGEDVADMLKPFSIT